MSRNWPGQTIFLTSHMYHSRELDLSPTNFQVWKLCQAKTTGANKPSVFQTGKFRVLNFATWSNVYANLCWVWNPSV